MVTTRRTNDPTNDPATSQPSNPLEQPLSQENEELYRRLRDIVMTTIDERLRKFEEDFLRRRQEEQLIANPMEDRRPNPSVGVSLGPNRGDSVDPKIPTSSDGGEGSSRPRSKELLINKVWKDIHRLKPPKFKGDLEPADAEEWIDRLETIFQATDYNKYQKARVAIFLLTHNAKRWWESAGGLDDSLTTWDEFKAKFLEHYFPPALRQEKEMAFYALRQGDMHEDEFIATYIDLSRYVKYLQEKEDLGWKSRQLIERARPELKEMLFLKPNESFEETCTNLRLAARMKREVQNAKSQVIESARPQDNKGKFSNFTRPIGGVTKKQEYSSWSSGKKG